MLECIPWPAGIWPSKNGSAIEYRWAEGRNQSAVGDRRTNWFVVVAVVPAMNTASVLAARAATTTIPIVFYTGTDPVQLGLVTSLA